mmetsp:Transcript_22520/g.64775  ORF Transcript_22520/g.64775 Transcript_22520/m.64775 type:complete len:103 (+) Transcript_22520:294-602(+)
MSHSSCNDDRDEKTDPLLSLVAPDVSSSSARSEAINESRRILLVNMDERVDEHVDEHVDENVDEHVDELVVDRLAVAGDVDRGVLEGAKDGCNGSNPMLDLT